ncbi:hypothetical protein HMPREF9072_00966 [Capnocytophaga sp. oral taxon 324 str. F0483]|nr:hypothetical protein HMPREF9072_00966 [Capnocytophaga sp. oral taxon 324 str. F0483]
MYKNIILDKIMIFQTKRDLVLYCISLSNRYIRQSNHLLIQF